MKFNRLIFFVMMACGLFTGCQSGTEESTTSDLSPELLVQRTSDLGLSFEVPADLPPNPTQASADSFAWQSFVALNWPAISGQRGVADPNKIIGQPGPLVWETWKAPAEIFLLDGSKPASWEQYGGSLPPECKDAGAMELGEDLFLLTRISKVPANSGNEAIERAKQAVGGSLTDQYGNIARYEIRMNKVIFEEIVSKEYYNVQGQEKASFIFFPNGVMEVKASWRELTDQDTEEIKKRFYRRMAWIYTPPSGSDPASCVNSEVGMVGLHISHKTASRPQWTWATFEQIDNVPPFNSGPPSGRTLPYSFNNPDCPPADCPPNKSTEKDGKPTGIPTQVTRVVNIGEDAQKMNPGWQQKLAQAFEGSPFQYYELVDIQWPKTPSQRPAGNPTPGLVANTTMETYVPESSCLNCHFTARTQTNRISSDYSFMLAEAHRALTGGN